VFLIWNGIAIVISLVPENRDKSRLVSLGRDKGTLRSAVNGGEIEEGRPINKGNHLVVEVSPDIWGIQQGGPTLSSWHDFPKILDCPNRVLLVIAAMAVVGIRSFRLIQ